MQECCIFRQSTPTAVATQQWMPWNEYNVLLNAGRCGSVPMLEWLKRMTKPWSQKTLGHMLVDAASCGRLAAARWLRAKGAQWPTSFVSEFKDSSDRMVKQCWRLSTLQWAVASGSGWLDWHCEDYADADYTELDAKKHAADVLKWEHANDCPCTCDHHQQQQQQQH